MQIGKHSGDLRRRRSLGFYDFDNFEAHALVARSERLNRHGSTMFTKGREARASICRSIFTLLVLAMATCGRKGFAQVTLAAALDRAIRTNPRILTAQDDVRRAQSTLRASQEIYIPSVIANGGAGDSYGITLAVPTIFTVNAQSLVYNSAQRDYIRAAKTQLQAANARSLNVHSQLEQEIILAYLDVDHAQRKLELLAAESAMAAKLLNTMQHRAASGIASDLDLLRSRRSAVEVRLGKLQADDELAFLREHLANLLNIPATQLTIVPESMPPAEAFDVTNVTFDAASPNTPALLDAKSNAAASLMKAAGDKRADKWPQISFAAQYGRISPINAVTDFYNIHGKYNTFFAGIQFQFPIIDRVQRAHADESQADAAHAVHALESLRADEGERRLRSLHAVQELNAKEELAQIDLEAAQQELESIQVQLQSSASGRQLQTPMDEDRARLHEIQLQLAALDATLELRKAQVTLLGQSGHLESRFKLAQAPTSPQP